MHRARGMFEHLRRMAVAYAVLLIALVLTFLAYHYVRQDVEDAARYRFSETVLAARSAIENQMGSYVDAMFGARAHFYASNSVEMEEWGGYANGIDLSERYEGMRVMGYAKRVEPEDRDEFVEELSQTFDGAGLPEPEVRLEAEGLLRGTLETVDPSSIDFEVYDGEDLTPRNLLYDEDGVMRAGEAQMTPTAPLGAAIGEATGLPIGESERPPDLSDFSQLDMAGEAGGGYFRALPRVCEGGEGPLPPFLFLSGLAVSFLLFGVTFILV